MSARTPSSAGDSRAARRAQLATAVVELLAQRRDLPQDMNSEEARLFSRKLGQATLELALAIGGDSLVLSELDREFGLLGSLVEVPSQLGAAGELELCVRVAEALMFCAPDDMKGQIALAHAQSGDRERALDLVLTNLETAREPFIAEFRAGDVYRELGEADAAEAYYRRSLALAQTASERSEVTLRITSLLIDIGRETDALAFLTEQRARTSTAKDPARSSPAPRGGTHSSPARVGRNDPCPCGSGKKYKKCHGV